MAGVGGGGLGGTAGCRAGRGVRHRILVYRGGVAMVTITVAERRARLAARHHLASGALAVSALQAAADLIGLHGTDPSSAYLACWSRVTDFETAELDRALYDDRSLLKILGMRRTMFIVPVELGGVIQSACTDAIAKGQRARLVRMLEEAGIADVGAGSDWLAAIERETVAVLDRLGEATAADLTKEVKGLRAQMTFSAGKRWQGQVGVSTRLLFLLSAEGRIIRGRPKGSLVSSLYRWAPMDRWVAGGLPSIPREDAQPELVRRYLGTYGPATLLDVRWWTGWTAAEARRALFAIDAAEVGLEDGQTGWVLPGDEAPEASPSSEPWIALLPALDSTIMGWQQRGWFLDPHGPRLFDRNGNAGPTIWIDGRVAGGWAQRRSGEIRWELLEDVGTEARALINARVASLETWLGGFRFVPRFRTPLEVELGA